MKLRNTLIFRPHQGRRRARLNRTPHPVGLAAACLACAIAQPGMADPTPPNPFFGASQKITDNDDLFLAGTSQWAVNNTGAVTFNGLTFLDGNADGSGGGAGGFFNWKNGSLTYLAYDQEGGKPVTPQQTSR